MIDEKRKQEIKDRYVLNNIKKGVENVMGTSIRHIYKSSDICEKYNKMLHEIYKIEFPVFLTKEEGDESYRYMEYLYEYLKLSSNEYNWLIPYFNGSNWWIELQINNLYNFINFYCPDNYSIDLTVFDVKNNLLFDVENGEYGNGEYLYEYRIVKW